MAAPSAPTEQGCKRRQYQLDPADCDRQRLILLGRIGGLWKGENFRKRAQMARDVNVTQLIGNQRQLDGVSLHQSRQPIKSRQRQRERKDQRKTR